MLKQFRLKYNTWNYQQRDGYPKFFLGQNRRKENNIKQNTTQHNITEHNTLHHDTTQHIANTPQKKQSKKQSKIK